MFWWIYLRFRPSTTMVAATGVLVAAVFYIVNLRETTRNRKATFASSQLQFSGSVEWQKLGMDVF